MLADLPKNAYTPRFYLASGLLVRAQRSRQKSQKGELIPHFANEVPSHEPVVSLVQVCKLRPAKPARSEAPAKFEFQMSGLHSMAASDHPYEAGKNAKEHIAIPAQETPSREGFPYAEKLLSV